MSEKKNTDGEITSAHAWLTAVAEEFDQDPALIRSLVGDLLDLTKHVAHGPSRPAAPLTAFMVGIATGATLTGEENTEAATAKVREKIAAVEALLSRYQDSNPKKEES